MVFIMLVYKSVYKLFLTVFLLAIFCAPRAYAKTDWVYVESMHWKAGSDSYEFLAELSFNLSPTAREALRSGIVLYWDVKVSVSNSHLVAFFNELIYSHAARYSLRYNTLFNDYRVGNEIDMSFRRFSTLRGAVDYLAIIKHVSITVPLISDKKCTVVDLSVLFDNESLPIPLRPIAYFDAGWDLSTNARLGCE